MVTNAPQTRGPAQEEGAAQDRSSARDRGSRLKGPERRELLEDAAARLFAQHGYEATTVEQICAAAGVSKPMLYRHFDSKQELARRLLERRRDELATAPLDEFVRRPDAGSLRAMTDSWFAHVEANPDSCRFLFRDITGDAELEQLQQELRHRQRSADVALLRELAPGIPEHELEPLGEAIRSTLYGVALWWLDHESVPRETVVDAILRLTSGLAGVHTPGVRE
ncbi:MAG TPA: TetR family transcriptional regulator [Solirubrobacteraceae bacterium]|nr:TetR family transcriptional regulator [Solirubrobacteraceae bacterium]